MGGRGGYKAVQARKKVDAAAASDALPREIVKRKADAGSSRSCGTAARVAAAAAASSGGGGTSSAVISETSCAASGDAAGEAGTTQGTAVLAVKEA